MNLTLAVFLLIVAVLVIIRCNALRKISLELSDHTRIRWECFISITQIVCVAYIVIFFTVLKV